MRTYVNYLEYSEFRDFIMYSEDFRQVFLVYWVPRFDGCFIVFLIV